MDSEKVSCSTGAACTAGVHRPSHVLMAMGLSDVVAQSSLRFSFGSTSTQADVDYTLSVLPGVIQPIADVVKIAGDIPVHCDAVQSFTKVPLSFKELGLFAMTISGHKVGGPLGIGALILRRAVEIPALLHGGGQERDIRSGTLNAPSIVAFAAAVEAHLYDSKKVTELRDGFEAGVLKARPDAVINGKTSPRLPGISNITFPGTQSDSLLLLMDSEKVSCSTGAACTAGVHRPSHVLMAMGLSDVVAQSSLRFSFGSTSTQADVDYTLSVLPRVIERGLAAHAVGRS